VRDRKDWTFDPVWFSFRNGRSDRRSLDNMGKALADQITARFSILALSGGKNAPGDTDDSSDWRRRIEAVTEATDARIDVVVDGIDEARDEGREILSYLQQFPGDGVVIVGTQPALIASIELERLELRTNTSSAHNDALDLIEQFANRFDGHDALQSIASRLRQDRWKRGLVERAGSNLWILTDFLSAVLSGHAAWPDRPEDLPLSDDVGRYVRNLLNAVLDGCRDDGDRNGDRKILNTFLAYLSFLGDRPWAVADVRRLAGDDIAGCDEATWSRNGLLSRKVKRLIDFNGNVVKFHSPFVREAVADNFQNYRRDVAERLVQVVRKADSSSDLLEFAVARLPTLLEEVRDPSLAGALLTDTPWMAERFAGFTDGASIVPFLEELQALLRQAKGDPNESDLSPPRDLFRTVNFWRATIESSPFAPAEWWPVLGTVIDAKVRQSRRPKVHAREPVLLAPATGYRPSAQSPDQQGVACGLEVGTQERLVVARLGGSVSVFARKGAHFTHEGGFAVAGGTIMQLDPLEGWLILALVRNSQWEGDCSLFLLDLDAPVPHAIDGPPGLRSMTVLDATAGRARVVMILEGADKQEMRVYRLSYNCVGSGAGRSITLEPEGESVSVATSVAHYSCRPRKFARDTWAIWSSLADGAQTFEIYRATPDGIQAVASTDLKAEIQGNNINGICPVPGDRLAVVVAPYPWHDSPGEPMAGIIARSSGQDTSYRASLLLVDGDGELNQRICLDSEIPCDDENSGNGQRVATNDRLGLLEPMGWHATLGLVLGLAPCYCLDDWDENYYVLDLEQPEALMRPLPPEIERRVRGQTCGEGMYLGSVQLTHERIVLLHFDFAVLLDPDPAAAVAIRWNPQEPIATTPAETKFLRIGQAGVSISWSGLRLIASDGSKHPRELVDLGEEFRVMFEGIEPVDVKHALCIDDDNWACGVLARRLTTGIPDAEGHTGENQAATDIVIVGYGSDGFVYLAITDVPADCDCRIEALANGLVGFRYGCVSQESDWTGHPLHLYDLVAKGLACPHPDAEVGKHDDSYAVPLLEVSTEWVLLLGSPTSAEPGNDLVYAAYQYRVGSLEPPSRIQGLSLSSRLTLVHSSLGRAEIRELSLAGCHTRVRSLQLEIDDFGIRVRSDHSWQIEMGGDADVTDLGGRLIAVASGDECVPCRVEVLRPPASGEEKPTIVAVGYLSQPPQCVTLAREPDRVSLVVHTDGGATRFELANVPACFER